MGKTHQSEQKIAAPCAEKAHRLLDDATGSTTIPGVSFLVVDRDNNTLFSHSGGVRNIETSEPFTLDTTLWIASCTKAITSAGLMLLVQDGKIDLDDSDVLYKHVPELDKMKVFDSFDQETGKSVFKEPTGRVTFKQIMTHSAGFSYVMFDKRMFKWALEDVEARMDSFEEGTVLNQQLFHEPGTQFLYGGGMEILSIFIKRFTGMSLGLYLRQRIFEPLGMKNTAFVPTQEMKKNIAVVHDRDGHPGKITITHNYAHRSLTEGYTEETDEHYHQGGAGLWSTVGDYCKFLTVYLNNGAPLFTEDTFQVMVQDHLSHLPNFAAVPIETAIPPATTDISAWFEPAPGKQGHGLSFLVQFEDVPGMRKKGSMSWAGLSNMYWWADPQSGIAGLIASQVQPFADPKTLELFYNVEREIYRGLEA